MIVILLGVVGMLLIYKTRVSQIGSTEESMIETSSQGEQSVQEANKPTKSSNSLDLSGQGLDKLPANVLSMTSLEELDISKNELTGALPAEIRHLKNLRILNASDNDMTGVPAEVGQLENLEILNLSNNKLTGLPYELGNLKNLKVLDLSGNDYATQDLERIKQGLSPDTQIIL